MKFHYPKFCATLWTFSPLHHPPAAWPAERKLDAIASAGFDGVHDLLPDPQIRTAQRLGLTVVGRLDGRFDDSWQQDLQRQVDAGVTIVNVHLGFHDTPPEVAARRAAEIHQRAKGLKCLAQFEIHRGTATETPERYDQVRTHFEELTSTLLPTTWDHSHFATVKHLLPAETPPRLLAWEPEIRASRLFHCRPFNGQHAQVPVTDGRGGPTPEFSSYLEFATALFTCWLQQPDADPSSLWICPEMGASEGYHLSCFPDPWSDAVQARQHLQLAWASAMKINESHDRGEV